MKRGKMKKWVSLFLGIVLCAGTVAVPVSSGVAVQAADSTSYEVNLPTDVAVTNEQSTDGNLQFIDVTYADESIGDKLDGTVAILDKDGTKINTTYFAVEGKIRIPLSNFASDTTYTLYITPDGLDAYSQTFTTGTIVDNTDVAVGLNVVEKTLKKYSVLDLLRGYDLDSVKITMAENTSGVEVLLTRDLTKDFDEMTNLGEIAAGTTEQTFNITGYNIGKYQYVIVKGTETVQEINAYVSSESMKGIKARPIGGDNVDLRFCSWSDMHMQANQREVNHMTDILTKAKSEHFGGHLDAMVLVGDIHYMFPDSTTYNAEMLNRYARLETIMTDNGYGFSNLDNDSDDIITTIYTAGNHEYSGSASNDVHAQRFVDQVDTFHAHKVVNGYHFIAASSDYDAKMTEDAAAWTKAEIEKAVADDPTGTKPIFVFAHNQALNTVTTKAKHGTINTTYYPGTSTDFVEWLKGYPQVVYISGHTHYAEQLETSIVQAGFTQVSQGVTGGGNLGGGSTLASGLVRDAIDNLSEENVYRPQGLIVETKNNVVYVYRIDFKTGGQIGNAWVIDTEGLQEKTARAYYTSERYDYSVAPYFEEGAAEQITVDYTTTTTTAADDTIYSVDAKITFPQAKSNDIYGDKVPMVYQLYIYDAETGTKVKNYGRWSDAIYWSENPFDVADETHHYEMDETWTIDLPALQVGRIYKVDIHAVNSFIKRSEPITVYVDYSNPENITATVDKPTANIVDNSYYDSISDVAEEDGYNFFGGTTGDVISPTYDATSTYSLEATFHMPMEQNGRLIGTDAHNLAITSSGLVYTYTVDGVQNTLTAATYYTNTCVDVVGTCDGTSAKLYVDGVLVKAATIETVVDETTGTTTGVVDALSGDIIIGNGIFASVLKARVYDKALSLEEIKVLKQETTDNQPTGGYVKQITVQEISTNATIYDGLTLDKLIDGTTTNFTALSGSTPREILLDLGQVYDLETVVLYQRTSSANDTKYLKITMSEEYIALADAASRKLIHYDEEGDGFTQGAVPNYMKVDMSDGNNQARYVYLTSSNSNLLVINEFKIFGKAITTQE